MIMNLYSANRKYSKALYIKIKFKFKIPKSYIYDNDIYSMVKTKKINIQYKLFQQKESFLKKKCFKLLFFNKRHSELDHVPQLSH